ncbi:MAG TPA: hypothetical protein VLV83_18435 [Acidobacteriota bacterium]|nr:hypothetical protein [Acidobacteriota bacterium]
MLRSLEPVFRRTLMVAVVLWLPAQEALRPITDTDIWWHLSVGRWIAENGGLPSVDPLTRMGAEGQAWVAYSWLYEIVMFGLYESLGPSAMILYTLVLALAIAAATLWLIRRPSRGLLLPFVLSGAAMLSMLGLIYDRPWMLTILFFILLLLALWKGREQPRVLWWTVPLFWLWANVHIVFVYGLGVMGFALLDGLAGRWGYGDGTRHFDPSATAKVLGACLLVTLLTPNHVYLWIVVAQYVGEATPFRLVEELQAPDFRTVHEWIFLFMSVAAAAALGWRRRRDVFAVLLLVAGIYLSHRASRDVWFTAIASALILADCLAGTALDPPNKPGERLAARHLPWVGLWVLAGLLLSGKWVWLDNHRLRESVVDHFPVAAADHVVSQGYSGPLYNHFEWGGYLGWRFQGLDLPVSIDGRTNLAGEQRLQLSVNSWFGYHGDWKRDPDLKTANLVVGPSEMPLIYLLEASGTFRKVYSDEQATVMIRTAPHPR